ncbi:hypothetical protein SASPL_156780 [Salvia splendens]|uniref:Transportin-3 n=1 Tax=Salvia splendens TaxID=180675 RepID=A0A8X8VW53_SALSN|nr:hypothetical protein SASPL_156780 [Salvia splendens]
MFIQLILMFFRIITNAIYNIRMLTLIQSLPAVISELIHYTTVRNLDEVASQMPLIQVLVPRIMNLKPHLEIHPRSVIVFFKDDARERLEFEFSGLSLQLEVVSEGLSFFQQKDEEDVKAVARLFADMEMHTSNPLQHGHEHLLNLRNPLSCWRSVHRMKHLFPGEAFFYGLYIIPNCYLFLSQVSVKVNIPRIMLIFQERTRKILSKPDMVHLPFDLIMVGCISNIFCGFHKTIMLAAVADVLIDAALVLGGDATLKILYMKLIEIMNLLPQLPHQPQLLQTVCYVIGAYSKWLDTAPSGPSFLSPLINILVSGMSISEDTAAAAAVAFRHICDDCKKKLCGSLDGLFQIYQGAMIGEGPFKVSAEDSLHLVEALSMVVTELPSEHAKKALEALCLPTVAPLQDIINQGPLVLGQKPARDLTVHIDRLANIFRHANHPEAVADAVQRLWPIFKSIFDIRSWDMRTMESLCRACKNAVRTSKTLMGVTVGVILEEIQALYKQHQQPCFLYLSSEVIKIFGSDPSCTNYLTILIESLFNHTTSVLTKVQDFSSRPDLVDDCFLLASRCIRYCPQLFFTSPVFPCLVDCSMIGITVQHREASNSILNFLSDVFDLANSTQGKPYVPIRDNVIIPRGAVITRVLVAALTGALPSSRLETVTYTLLAITRAYSSKALEWAKDAISLIPSNAVTDVERSRFLQALSDAMSGAAVNGLTTPIEELSEVCRRNRSVQEIVQGALRPLELNMVSERSRFLQALSDAMSGAAVNGLTTPIEELSEVCRRNRSVQEIVQGALRPLELNMVSVS